MKKTDIALKTVACIVVGLIFAGLANITLMQQLIPFIIAGTAVVLILYIISAFKNKNYARIITIVSVMIFAMIIIVYKRLG